jgi:ankyrin repeat protein
MGIKMSSVCVIKTTTLRFVIRKPFQECPATLTLRQLHLAAYFGRVNIVEHLLNKGAIYSGSREAIKLLIDKGASLVTVDSYNAGPLFLAAHFSDLSMFEYLIDACAGKLPPEEYDKALVAAADAGRVEVFSKLLSYSHPQECFQEALEVATKEDNWDIIMMLLERYQGRTLDCNNLFEEASSTTENQDKVLQVSSLSPIFKYLRLPWDFLCMEEYAKLRFVGCVGARQR